MVGHGLAQHDRQGHTDRGVGISKHSKLLYVAGEPCEIGSCLVAGWKAWLVI